MSTATVLDIPVLDLSRLHARADDKEAFIAEVRHAAHVYGFFYVTGHGVPTSITHGVLDASRRFFALPLEDRLAIDNVNSPHFRGYSRLGTEYTQGVADHRDQLDVGPESQALRLGPDDPAYLRLVGPNQWPTGAPWLKPAVLAWYRAAERVSKDILRALSLALGQSESYFDRWFDDDAVASLKVARYPGVEHPEDVQGLGAHKDSGWLALLLQDGTGGLQGLGPDGHWYDVAPIEDAFVVNVGEMLEVATEGYLRGAVHRVVAPPRSTERISVPFFFGPRLDAIVPTVPLPRELAGQARGVEKDPNNPLFAEFGENVLKSRLRSHQETAERWWSDVLLSRP